MHLVLCRDKRLFDERLFCVYGDASVTFSLSDVKAARSLLVYMHPTLHDINRPGEALTLRAQAFPSLFCYSHNLAYLQFLHSFPYPSPGVLL